MTREDARIAARRAVDATGLTRASFAKEAGIDSGTLSDFLDGKRWVQGPTRTKIEQRLGWPIGRINDIAEGIEAMTGDVAHVVELSTRNPVRPVPEPQETNPVLAAIEADPNLLPEAKAHLLNQYGLLLRVAAAADQTQHLPHVARRRPDVAPMPPDPKLEHDILRDVERAAAENPKGPRGGKPRR